MIRLFTSIPRRWLLLALLLILVTSIARALPGPRTIDDAFITFRYSRNIVEGQGFVYNAGVPSLGTTTPLFTLLMALISALTGQQDFQWYAITVSILADSTTAILLVLLARRLTAHDWLALIPGLLWALSPYSVTFAVGGMETSLNICWMLAAFSLFVLQPPSPRRQMLIGLFAALGFLTRIDSALWIGPLFLAHFIESWLAGRPAAAPFLRRLPLRTWITFVLALLPWFAFSAVYFGSPFPRSLSAKTVAYNMPPGSAFIKFIQTYTTPFVENLTLPSALLGLLAIIYLVLTLTALLFTARRLPRLLPFLLYPWLYMIVFSVANPLIFRWYVAPPLPAFTLGLFIGLFALVTGLSARRQPGLMSANLEQFAARPLPTPSASRLLPIIGLVALFWGFAALNAWTLHPDHGADRPAPQMAWHQIELYYQDIATQLRDEYGVTPATLVASGDIGVVGYFSRATILDTVGLVTPTVSHYYPIPASIIPEGQNYAIPPQLILDYDPAFLVAMESMVRLGLEQSPEFKAEYRLVRDIPTDFYGKGMYLYQRQG